MKSCLLTLLMIALCSQVRVFAQSPSVTCSTTAVPPLVRSEGLTERIGDIVYTCTGQAGTQITTNLTIALNVNITNRLSSGSSLTGVILTVDSGSGPQAVPLQPQLLGPGLLVYNGVTFTLSPAGTATLTFSDIRANATQAGTGVSIIASLGVNGSLLLNNASVNAGMPKLSLYAGQSSLIVCAQNGSKVPTTISVSSLLGAGTVFTSTRVTEGFADAFQPKSGYANLNADSGMRFIVIYSGFPQSASLYVPDVIAGSDATQPTAGGDFGFPASGGSYTPGSNTLLLARVQGADSNGAGGAPVYVPPSSGPAVQFDSASQLQMVNGTAYVVYEVVDSDLSRIESAQFPTFLGLPAGSVTNPVETSETVTLAPVSAVSIATTTDPIPRFIAQTPPPDCTIVGDCSASYQPKLSVQPYDAYPATGPDPNTVFIRNVGSGVMQWTVTATYPTGTPTGWLTVTPASGSNSLGVRVDGATNLTPGTYHATLVIDAGPIAGSQTVPVTYTVAASTPQVTVNSILNAASFAAAPVVPGSLVSIMGAAFTGKSIAVTFGGEPGTILFSNNNQINVLVPADLASSTTNVIVTVDGNASAPQNVAVAQFAPAIFKGAVLNQDWTVNGASNPAAAGSVIQIYATGLSGKGTITAQIGNRVIAVPYYAGPAPGFAGVQQIDLLVPSDFAASTTDVFVCGAAAGTPNTPVCSVAQPLTVK
ncbi:MAG: IPT/TIG domain-containing protein [Bryobacteraceae bacterium]